MRNRFRLLTVMSSAVILWGTLMMPKIVFASWLSDPKPTQSYSLDDLLRLQATDQAQWRGQDGFVLDEGNVFYVNSDFYLTYIPDAKDVQKMILFKGQLVILNRDGDIYIFAESADQKGEVEWANIGRHTTDIATDDENLLALTSEKKGLKTVRSLLVYKGERPGNLTRTVIPIKNYCGENCYYHTYIPVEAGSEITSTDMDMHVPGAVKLQREEQEGGQISVITEDGKSVPLGRDNEIPQFSIGR